jgi:5-methyltetrahydrofolate--homocysteine methyltransferase
MAEQDVFSQLRASLGSGEREDAKVEVTAALEKGIAIKEILGAIANVLDEVGRKYQNGEYYLTELILSATAAEEAIKTLTPYMKSGEIQAVGKIVLGTVRGDLHDLGKTIVNSMLHAGGFEVIDLGVDVPSSKFAQTAKEVNADIVASSALLTTSKIRMREIEDELVKAGIREKVKTMIGGAAVTVEYAKEIGADSYGKDAFEAVTVARSLVNELRKKGGK